MSEFDYRELDSLIHSRIRLNVMAILASVHDATFAYLKEQTGATDGNLGAHLRKLEEADYIEVDKTFVDRVPTSRYRLTSKGRQAFAAYVERMERLLGGASSDEESA